jgi:hypothetical protein
MSAMLASTTENVLPTRGSPCACGLSAQSATAAASTNMRRNGAMLFVSGRDLGRFPQRHAQDVSFNL